MSDHHIVTTWPGQTVSLTCNVTGSHATEVLWLAGVRMVVNNTYSSPGVDILTTFSIVFHTLIFSHNILPKFPKSKKRHYPPYIFLLFPEKRHYPKGLVLYFRHLYI